jgi:hypothetical protein
MKRVLLLMMFPILCFGQIDVPIQNISVDSNVRYRLFATKNMYTFIKLDTRNGLMWQVQWSTKGIGYRYETELNKVKYAKTTKEITEYQTEKYKEDSAYWEKKKEDWYKKKSDTTLTEEDFYYKTEEDLALWHKPKPLEESINLALKNSTKALNGRFFLYPTTNSYNFILLDQIDGRAWQVQWNIEKSDRMVLRIY